MTHAPVRRWRWVLTALVSLALGGCLPSVAWLPDSSGFVYLARDKDGKHTRLVHFDLKTKQGREVVTKGDAETGLPAVSPDGKRYALAKFTHHKDRASVLRILVVDGQGKALSESKDFEWRPLEVNGKPYLDVPPALYWSPGGEHILVYAHGVTGIFDVKTQALTVTVRDSWVACFGGTPIRPDGAGFLILKKKSDPAKKEEDVDYVFVDWQGREQVVKAPMPHFFTNPFNLFPHLYQSHWEKHVAALVLSEEATFLFDTTKLTFDRRRGDPGKGGENSGIHSRYPLTDGVVLQMVTVKESKEEQAKNKSHPILAPLRVELHKAGQAKPTVLVPRAGMVTVTPAPNGEFLAVCCYSLREGPGSHERERILVVTRKGEVIGVEGGK